jgi:hypothetical protein
MATRLSRRGGYAAIFDRRIDGAPSDRAPLDVEQARAVLSPLLDDDDGNVRALRDALAWHDPLGAAAGYTDDEVAERVAVLLGERALFLDHETLDVSGMGGGEDPGDIDPVDPVAPVETKHWIEVELKDPAGDPVRFARYRIELPDGSVAEGALDAAGAARVAGLDAAGTCKISFPRLDGRALKRA